MLLFRHIELFGESGALHALWADAESPSRGWADIDRLVLRRTHAGEPELTLVLIHDDHASLTGGLLRVGLTPAPLPSELVAEATSAGITVARIHYDAARYRLRLRGGLGGTDSPDGGVGPWRSLAMTSGELVSLDVVMTQREAEIARHLFVERTELAEVEVELLASGLEPGVPWRATCHRPGELCAWLRERIPTEGATLAELEAVWSSMPLARTNLEEVQAEYVTFTPYQGESSSLSVQDLLKYTARHALGTLFDRLASNQPFDEPRYQMRPAEAASELDALHLDMSRPIPGRRVHVVRSAAGQWLGEMSAAEQERAFSVVARHVSALEPAAVHLVSSVPFDPMGLKSVHVDLRTTGTTGAPETHTETFDGSKNHARWLTTHRASEGFAVDVRLSATLAPPLGQGWPRVIRRDWERSELPIIHLSRELLGVEFVRIDADEELFHLGSAVVAEVGSGLEAPPIGRARLDVHAPGRWLALPDASIDSPLVVTAWLLPPEGRDVPPRSIAQGEPIVDRRLYLSAQRARAGRILACEFRLAAQAHVVFATLSIRVVRGDTAAEPIALLGELEHFVLRPDEPVLASREVTPTSPESLWEPIALQYRLGVVRRRADGTTTPLEWGAWTSPSSSPVDIFVPPSEG